MKWKKIVLIFLTAILINNNSLFAATDDLGHEQKKVAAPAAKAQALFKEFSIPTPYSQPFKIAVDKNGIVWFTEQGNNALGKFDPKTTKFSEYKLPSAKGADTARWGFSETDRKAFTGGFSVSSVGSLAGIAIDSRGDIWFAELLGNKIGRFSPAKEEFSEYSIPTTDSGPYNIAIDSKGDVWFTERNANKIGRFTIAASTFKEYSIPTPNSKPAGIAVDQRDNVWFTLSDTNKIGMLESQTGNITEYNILTPTANPYDIAIDSKGNVWFTELSANKLGMYSPQMKRFDEAVVPTTSSVPLGLAIDKYDRIWFTENRGNKIGLFDPASAVFKEHDIPTTQSLPIGIAVSPSGDIWFVEGEREANRIGFIEGQAAAPPEKAHSAKSEDSGRKSWQKWNIIILIGGIVITGLILYLAASSRKRDKR
ncbi:MAG: hypothetical protein HZA05_03525 [Nitrospirae bacterium]|nr:hypothetical protein [Nitrospirota bacterium]